MKSHRLIYISIMAAVLVWGGVLAIGAYLYNHNPWRPIVVMGCVLAFLGFWGLMLVSRRARLGRQEDE